MAEKTEQPTSKKLQDARKKGQIAFSREVPAAATFLAGATIVMVTAPWVGATFASLYRVVVATIPRLGENGGDGMDRLVALSAVPAREAALGFAVAVAPIWSAIAIAGLAAAVAQAGLNATSEPLKPSLKKLNPLSALKRIFSKKGFIDFLKNLVKVAIVAVLGYSAVSAAMPDVVRLHFAGVEALFGVGVAIATRFTTSIAIAYVAIAAADYFATRFQWKKDLMMTKDEVKREYKESEGDPMIKSQRKAIAQQMILHEISIEVPKADAVVVNPTHLAIALRYDRGKGTAPKVTAKGGGVLAQRIIEIAKKNEVPIVRDITLARALFVVEMGRHVPRELFEAVAEVILFAWRLRQEAQRVPGGV